MRLSLIEYPLNIEKITGYFIRRKNRFVVTAEVNGEIRDCHLPNPGRLWELLIPGQTELVLVKNPEPQQLPFTVLACRKNSNFVLLHTHLTNRVIKNLINEGRISFYKGFKVKAEEVKLSHSRIDLLLEGNAEKLYLEVKTCTLFGEKIAMFPDAVSERGKKHLIELKEMAVRGIKTSVLFVVMSPQVEYFLPAYHIDYEFSKAFMEVKDKVDLKAIALDWDKSFSYVTKVKELKIPYSFIKNALKERGVYLLLIYLEKPELIRIGKLGEIDFPSGYYVYVGKAMDGLFSRIARHKRKIKKLHWHIDYLLTKAKVIKDIPILSDSDIECVVAESLNKICDNPIPNFGCSDCQCSSHLFYFSENPIFKREFVDMVNYYRMDINTLNEKS